MKYQNFDCFWPENQKFGQIWTFQTKILTKKNQKFDKVRLNNPIFLEMLMLKTNIWTKFWTYNQILDKFWYFITKNLTLKPEFGFWFEIKNFDKFWPENQ